MSLFSKHRWVLVAVVNYFSLFIVAQANYYFALIGVNLLVVGMLISFSALELNFKQGILSLIPIALFMDSKMPLPFGFSLILGVSLFTLAYIARSRIRREISASNLATSIFLNLLAFCAYTISTARNFGTEGLHFSALSLNLFVSLLVVILCNKTYCQIQILMLALFGINLAEEQREAR